MNSLPFFSMLLLAGLLVLAPSGKTTADEPGGGDYAAAWSEAYGGCVEACPIPSLGPDRKAFGTSLKRHAACTQECRRRACGAFEAAFERAHQTTSHRGGCI